MKKLEQLIYNVLQKRKTMAKVLIATVVLLILSVMMIPSELVKAKMLPGKDSSTFSVYIDLPEGSSMAQTKRVGSCVINTLQKEHDIADLELYLGRGGPLDFAGLIKGSNLKQGRNVAEVVANLHHERSEPSFTMVHRIRPVLNKTCTTIIAGTNIKLIEVPAGPPTQAAVVAEIYGDHGPALRSLAKEVSKIFQKTEGLVDVDILQDVLYPKYQIKINSEKVSQSELTIKQVNEILYLAFEGMNVTVKNSQYTPDQIPVFMRLDSDSKDLVSNDIESIHNKLSELKLMNKKGQMIALSELINVIKTTNNPMQMSKNLRPMVAVVAEADLVSQIYPLLDARTAIKEELEKTYKIESASMLNLTLTDKKSGETFELVWDGELKVTLDTFRDLGGAFIAALILIFLLMVIYYKNFAHAGIVLAGSFLSIIGVIIGHWVVDIFTTQTFFLTATSLIGFIALIGISSRNSLLLIDFTFSLMKKGLAQDQAIAIAVATRAKPIFLTATAIILASTLLAGDAVFGGLGVALIFGTIAAVFASLLVVPVLMHYTDMDCALRQRNYN